MVKGKHFFRLGADELRIPAGDINEAMLEEFAKMLIGQPSGAAQISRRGAVASPAGTPAHDSRAGCLKARAFDAR